MSRKYFEMLKEELKKKRFLFGWEIDYVNEKPAFVFCFELCTEYFDYLKKVLKDCM
jgi:hypothetical protein